jgi:hypothetical protein
VVGLLGADRFAGLDPGCVRWRSPGLLHDGNRADRYSGASGAGPES